MQEKCVESTCLDNKMERASQPASALHSFAGDGSKDPCLTERERDDGDREDSSRDDARIKGLIGLSPTRQGGRRVGATGGTRACDDVCAPAITLITCLSLC